MDTIWRPGLEQSEGPIYRAIAERLAEDIRSAKLAPGTRLPTMRALADELSITVGTVYRAYELAEKKGLIVRELGRGTYVRDQRAPAAENAPERDGAVDLSRNEPVDIPLGSTLRRSLQELARDGDLDGLLDYGFSQGQPRHREALAQWIKARGYDADPEHLIVTSGAQQALTIALGALARAGDTLMVEALTYPGIKNLARLFGLALRPVAVDDDGLLPDDFAAACAEGARVLFCMPNVHNPTTATLSLERRRAIAETAARHGVRIIEDDVYPRATAAPLPAFAELYPEATVYISSLSKTVAPGLRVGSIACPRGLYPDLVAVTQTTSWMAPPLMAELACRWIEDGTAAALAAQRDQVTRDLGDIAARGLAGLPYRAEPHNGHLWIPLARPWTGTEFAGEAAERNVLVAPAEDFAIDPSRAPAAVRVCLPKIPEEILLDALGKLVTLAQAGPGPAGFRM